MGADTESALADQPPVGKILAGRYRLGRLLGRGGMGLVFRAFDLERQGDVALKTLQRCDADTLYAFKNEFRQLADIHHPNLVRLGELVCDGEHWFFTMELVDGQDVVGFVRAQESEGRDDAGRTTVRAGMPFDARRLQEVLLQLCSGLDALHGAGKVHRDIKPENVLVARDGRLVLLDFGLVTKAMEMSRTEDGWILGTPLYMAPEQAMQRPVGPEADWYGVGAMLYEMLAGRPPFSGAVLEILDRKQREVPPRPRDIVGAVPAHLDDLCMELLAHDPAARPRASEVRARVQAAAPDFQAATATTVPTVAMASPFVGRTTELEQLGEALIASEEQALAVVVRGESGVGKSALVRHFGVALQETGQRALVLTGRCYERESVPYKAFDGVVDALSRHLIRQDPVDAARVLPRERDAVALLRIFPVLRRVPAFERIEIGSEATDAHQLRRKAFAALRELLSRLADRQRLVLAIDDLQWADADSLVLLEEILRPPGAPRVLLVATHRGEIPPIPGAVREIALGGLGLGEGRLLAQTLGVGANLAEAITVEAKGHPLFIQELAARNPELGDLRLDQLLWARIAPLAPGTLEVLQLIALASMPLALRHLARTAGAEPAVFADRIGELRDARLIRTLGGHDHDSVECYHDRIRETVLAHLEEPALVPLHRRLAAALDRDGVGEHRPEILFRHLELGGQPALAAPYAVRAAELAEAALAFEQAAERYRAALRLGQFGPDETRRLQRLLGRALINAGRGREAADAFGEAARDAPTEEAIDCRRQAAEQLLISGHLAEGMAALREVVSTIGIPLPKTPRRVLMSLLWRRARVRLRGLAFQERDPTTISAADLARMDICWSATMGLSMIDPIRGAEFQARHLLLALDAGEISRIAHSLAIEATHLTAVAARPTRRATRAHATAKWLAEKLDQPYTHAGIDLSAGIVAYLCGRWLQALEHLDRASATMRERCTGAAWEIDTANLFGIFSLWFSGQLAELGRRVRRLGEEAERRGDFYAAISLKTSLGNMAWLASDELAEAQAHVAEARRRWTAPGFQLQSYFMLLADTNLHLYGGDGPGAFALMTKGWRPLAESLLLRVQMIAAPMLHARAAAALAAASAIDDGRARDALLRGVLRDARKLAKKPISGYSAVADLLRAGVAATRGLGDRAASLLEGAAQAFDAADMALYAAAVRHRLGELGVAGPGRALINDARAVMAAQGVANPERMLRVLAPGFGTA